ncbi:MAG: hypothetical protein L3J34_11295, partial [Flavobacteriaceae bacterium]|nr:hypothetical protein [Flavobacteriaceae bacterium]
MRNGLKINFISFAAMLLLCSVMLKAQKKEQEILYSNEGSDISKSISDDVLPVMASWFWGKDEFDADGYKAYIDAVSKHAPYNLIVQSTRGYLKEVTDFSVYQQIKSAVKYAKKKGI